MGEETRDTSAASKLEEVVTTDGSKSKKKKLVSLGVAVVLILVVLVGVFAVGGNNGRKLQEQLDLGNKYLDEMDYERALVAFHAVLEIDPKNADAYEGLISIYAAQQDAQGIVDTYLQAAEYLEEAELDRIQRKAANQLETLIKEAMDAGEYDRAETYADLLAQVDAARAVNVMEQIAQVKAEAERLVQEEEQRQADLEWLNTSVNVWLEGNTLYASMETEIPIQETYMVNNPDVRERAREYGWTIRFSDDVYDYEIGSTSWRSTEGEQYSKPIYDMQCNLWKNLEPGSMSVVEDAEIVALEGNKIQYKVELSAENQINGEIKIKGSEIVLAGETVVNISQ